MSTKPPSRKEKTAKGDFSLTLPLIHLVMIDDNDDDNFNRKAALKLHLPQSYSPMHSSHTKDCTAQKTI